MSNTILITGGAGFIGSCLVRQILAEEQDTRIINLDKLTYAGNLDSLRGVLHDPRHSFVQGDVANLQLVAKLIRQTRPAAIIHLAAESHVDRSIEGPGEFVHTNVVGTYTMLEAARKYWSGLADDERGKFRFLHVSTDEVYGSLGATGSFNESTPYAPRSPYSASKAAADHMVQAYHATYGLPTLITNCSNNFGPFQFPEKLIPLVILNALEGRTLPVYGDGLHVRDWLFVEDHCRAIRLVLNRASIGETYNIGANCERTNLDVVRHVCRLIDAMRPELPHRPTAQLIAHVADRPGHDRRYAIDANKLRRELGWEPRHDFDGALEITVRWYLENSEWVERVTTGTYQRQRLGLAVAENTLHSRKLVHVRRAMPTNSQFRKGIILAGGSGSRLYPLTRATSKQLLPIYDKPMVYYPLSVLMQAGIQHILLISTPEDIGGYQRLFGDGSQLGLTIEFAEQPRPDGLAQAFIIGRDFIGTDHCALVLGDNLFYGPGIVQNLRQALEHRSGATVFGYPVDDPHRYGVVEFDQDGHAISLEEKPLQPRSKFAVPGLYFYDNQVVNIAAELTPSRRGELEITEVNRVYLERGQLHVVQLGSDVTWMDAGTHESLLQAAQYVFATEAEQGAKIGCIEEIAYREQLIDADQLERLAKTMNNAYGHYLLKVLRGEIAALPRPPVEPMPPAHLKP